MVESSLGSDSFTVGVRARTWIVYREDGELRVGDTFVLPLEVFLRRLHG